MAKRNKGLQKCGKNIMHTADDNPSFSDHGNILLNTDENVLFTTHGNILPIL